ncbi:uncharacterized protein LOC105432163 [Pogonomyrmex barbatus]|uniref:Uncharacterized protein LOC105432163 n=1 Tax=Pogonomyrmex barbatus TaxID=144034 RepID=A0A6I9WNL4_9HYME|nr:uncharacterized protein LOC105432163 [Pogonomyrmex barbatus]
MPAGHQSEDDGYMSMNGRKAKMALVALRPVPDCPEPQDPAGVSTQEFPPPPEEAERIISTLLPMVSPGNSSKRNVVGQASERRSVSGRQQWMVTVEDSMRHGNAVTTQTTLPKTRHQRPYGWENGTVESLRLAQPPSPPSKFASLPYDGKVSFNWIPPRTNPSAVEKHREVRRRSSEECLEILGVGSASKLRDFDDWQDQRLSTTDDDLISPYSDSSTNDLDQIRPQELTKNGTYVIRRGRKKERKVLPKTPTKTKSLSFENGEERNRLSDVKRYSSTFDNIKSLLKEGKLEALDEPPAEFAIPVSPPDLIRVVSMPAINNDANNRAQLEITVEEEETSDVSDKDKERDNIELPRLPPSPIEEDQMGPRPDRSRDSNGVPTAPNLADLDIGRSLVNNALAESQTKKKLTSAVSDERLASKIPVNLLIEDQIVKKALKENRRQLEKVSDAIKEIENVKNSESYCESKRWRNGDLKQSSKRNSFESEFPSVHDGRKPVTIDGSPYDGRSRSRQQQQQQQQQQYSSDSETSKTSSDADFADRRKLNGATEVVYSSGRRLRQNGIENHKNDQKQIENVIDAILEDSKNPEFQVSVDVMEFPPLPPSPVEEADEESCSDVGQSAAMTPPKSKSHSSSRTVEYRPRVPPHRVPPVIDPKEQASLNTRSMDAGFARGRRTPTTNNSRREVPVERRTLPTDLPGPSRRRPFTKRHSPSAEACSSGGSSGGCGTGGSVVTGTGSGMQTSCSLPETPVFARGSDIPKTPQHAGNPTQTRRQPGWYAPITATGYRRNNPGLEQAIIGTELLRLAGGPNRGWYPTRKANQPRPASIEHLERLNNAYDARLPGTGDQRKPLTLPTNITPNKYFGQSKHSSASSTREALRRVTSLLIKKGSGNKDGKGNKDNNSPSGPYAGCADGGDAPKKKGFFKGFWKRSRHYSLENQ